MQEHDPGMHIVPYNIMLPHHTIMAEYMSDWMPIGHQNTDINVQLSSEISCSFYRKIESRYGDKSALFLDIIVFPVYHKKLYKLV